MDLYLLRHADADTDAPSDDLRRLSLMGIEQSKRVAAFCVRHRLQPNVLLTSPLPRARETAEIVARGLNIGWEEAPWLAAGATAETFLAEMAAYRAHNMVMLVGHEPDLAGFVARLTGAYGAQPYHIRKASLTHLWVMALREGAGQLQASIPETWMAGSTDGT
jgi:phosphohistidine phosphatase